MTTDFTAPNYVPPPHFETRTWDDVHEIGTIQAKRGRRKDVVAAVGESHYEESQKKPGRWRVRVPIRDGDGKPTKAYRQLMEQMAPARRLEEARGARRAALVKHVALRTHEGSTILVEDRKADWLAKRDGLHSASRPGGNPVERGDTGMLWRLMAGRWWPLGVRCMGTPLSGSAHIPVIGLHRAPDGTPWRGINGEWVCLMDDVA